MGEAVLSRNLLTRLVCRAIPVVLVHTSSGVIASRAGSIFSTAISCGQVASSTLRCWRCDLIGMCTC